MTTRILLAGLFMKNISCTLLGGMLFPFGSHFAVTAGLLYTIPNQIIQNSRKRCLATRNVKRMRLIACKSSSDGNDNLNEKEEPKDYDLFDYFDPRLSPHLYPGGIPSPKSQITATSSTVSVTTIIEEEERYLPRGDNQKIGILLIDHGSKRESSNIHLESLARAYERSSRCPPHYIVRAAHMEIAAPSIEDGLRGLIAEGSYRIVCHPLFLSPGRHASEDVPRLIKEATNSIRQDELIPNRELVDIVTTAPLGSRMDVLIDIIGDIVEEKIRSSSTFRPASNQMEGFFGDVMKMMENEL